MFLTGQNISMVTLISSIVIFVLVVNMPFFYSVCSWEAEGMARFAR